MKKIILFLVIGFALKATTASAQVSNSGFEQLNFSDNRLSYWGFPFFMVAWIDSSGVSHSDSIVRDHDFYFSTTDAHTGTKALEMRNAFNYTQNVGYAGGAYLSIDSDFASFQTIVQVATPPTDLSFYYKYFPLNHDTAYAQIDVSDSWGNPIGSATILLGDSVSNYTLATTPIVYFGTGTPTYIELHFLTQLNGKQPTFGTRLLIDDVSLSKPTSIKEVSVNENDFTIYPNPAGEWLKVNCEWLIGNANTIQVTDILGRKIIDQKFTQSSNQQIINSSNLPNGIYFLKLTDKNGNVKTKKFVIEK